jgi:hypothetical protein
MNIDFKPQKSQNSSMNSSIIWTSLYWTELCLKFVNQSTGNISQRRENKSDIVCFSPSQEEGSHSQLLRSPVQLHLNA